ncbi:MAG: acetate/propionate family kinase [Thermoleophilia bacterium]
MRVLVINAGSSTLKVSVVDPGGPGDGPAQTLPAPSAQVDEEALRGFVAGAGAPDAVGHRVVHGGAEFTAATRIDADVRRRLEQLTDLAPLHQPAALRVIDRVGALLPGVPAVACFDTAFHAHLPEAAATYALPEAWRRRWGLRRYGFHGLSHAHVADRLAALMGPAARDARVVSCHLGAGASLAAIRGGTSVDTTMGFTPLEGLVMATRAGSVDPGLVLWLAQRGGLSPREIEDGLEHESGLLGLAGSADMREVLAAEAGGDPRAAVAMGVYLHRLRAGIASMAAAMDGLDALVFTGGVGEHAPEVRGRAAAGLAFLGVAVADDGAAGAPGDTEITAPGARVRTFVVRAREDLRIAREVRALLGDQPGPTVNTR